ncbi:MAG: 3-hydroxyacyl-CoA dehydrogenase NAD-binding domain-containing protein [Novosphingobium sp.]
MGVIGSGTMGSGIALAFLSSGFDVVLLDRSTQALKKAESRITRSIDRSASKGRISREAADRQIAALATTDQMAAIANCDLVIEAVFESLEVKSAVFGELDKVLRSGAILATNTSFLDVDALAAVTRRPADVVGLHFFAPANIMRLLEIVRGRKTSDEVLVTTQWLASKLGKLGIVSGVCHGFIANRVMSARRNAANALVLQGAAPQDIDRVMADYGFSMGPYRMLDLVGLDVGWDLENSGGRTVQEILCEAGDLGQKSGAGYYDYSSDTPVPNSRALKAIDTIRQRQGSTSKTFSDEEILFALLDPVVNEGARLLEEGIALRASDIDTALVAGYGWPRSKGGPMFWADTIGLQGIVERLEMRRKTPLAVPISTKLREMAAQGRRFVRLD